MRLISPILKHAVYPSLAKAGYLRHRYAPGPVIVTYHGVLPEGYEAIDPDLDGSLVTMAALRRQLRLLKGHYHVVSPKEFLLWCERKQDLPPRAVLLTCDDGLRNVLDGMLPILQELCLSCLFFITGASLHDVPAMLWHEELYLMFLMAPENLSFEFTGLSLRASADGRRQKRSLWWDLVRNLSRCESSARQVFLEHIRRHLGLTDDWKANYASDYRRASRFFVMNRAELRSLQAAGMTIGAHTLSHPMLSKLPAEIAWQEISQSRSELEGALGQRVWALAYPFGDAFSVGQREMEMAERAGFECAFMNGGGGFGAQTPHFALPRVHVAGDMNLAEFEAHVSGFYRSLRQRFAGTPSDTAVAPRN